LAHFCVGRNVGLDDFAASAEPPRRGGLDSAASHIRSSRLASATSPAAWLHPFFSDL